MPFGFWLAFAIGLAATGLLYSWDDLSEAWETYVSTRVRAWWRRRQMRQYAKHQQRIQQEWNPRAEAMRRFGKEKSVSR